MIGAAQTAAAREGGGDLDGPQTFGDVFESMIPEGVQEVPADIVENEKTATGIWKYQRRVYDFYQSTRVQVFVAALIFMNFAIECLTRQIDPSTTKKKYDNVWLVFEYFFTFAFLIELIINMYGSWRKTFLSSTWNYFDMFVVSIGILLLIVRDLPGPLNFVKMCRAFRVFRLFGRIPSLKKILVSIEKALPGVGHAFIIMILVVCIYAVIAVDFYSQYYVKVNADDPAAAITGRGERYGEEYYGNFFRALYTLFQILTGESWSEMGVRPVLHNSPDVQDNIIATVFFITFVLINGVILLNVVVAVLLDGMTAAAEEQKQRELEEEEKATKPNGENGEQKKEIALPAEVAQVKAQVAELKLQLKEALTLLRHEQVEI